MLYQKMKTQHMGESVYAYSALITSLTVYNSIKYNSCDVNHVILFLMFQDHIGPFVANKDSFWTLNNVLLALGKQHRIQLKIS